MCICIVTDCTTKSPNILSLVEANDRMGVKGTGRKQGAMTPGVMRVGGGDLVGTQSKLTWAVDDSAALMCARATSLTSTFSQVRKVGMMTLPSVNPCNEKQG